jgi:hypothetical protein
MVLVLFYYQNHFKLNSFFLHLCYLVAASTGSKLQLFQRWREWEYANDEKHLLSYMHLATLLLLLLLHLGYDRRLFRRRLRRLRLLRCRDSFAAGSIIFSCQECCFSLPPSLACCSIGAAAVSKRWLHIFGRAQF